MNFLSYQKELEAVLPGITESYKKLRSPDYVGIYTSNGEFFNHTFFGRDAGMTAKFVCNFDHEVAVETIYMLAAYQGVGFDKVTGEQPGKIHHEFRDFTTWRGNWFNRIGFYFMRLAWGARNRQMLTYFADDATATYIRLIHKYANQIDKSILSGVYKDKNNRYMTISESIEKAANWIADNVSDDGLFAVRRSNRLALPFQIFQDSITAYVWSDGRVANFSDPISYVEAQAYGLDALQDACHLLPTSQYADIWRQTIDKMTHSLLNDFWDHDKQFFASAISRRGGVMKPLDVPNISAGFTLNNLFWTEVPKSERQQKISSIIERLFSDEFLTDVGLRTRSKLFANATKKHVEYHDQYTVWTMFNFMVIEGLRKHRLYELAQQLELRLLRAAKNIEGFQEFYVVDSDGKLYQPSDEVGDKLSAQMKPERDIAFTVVPMIRLARRQINKQVRLDPADWQRDLEQKILNQIPIITADDLDTKLDISLVRFKRGLAGMSSFIALARRVRR